MAKRVKVPLHYQPPGNRPRETLAYISPEERQMLLANTDGHANMTAQKLLTFYMDMGGDENGHPSMTDDTGSSGGGGDGGSETGGYGSSTGDTASGHEPGGSSSGSNSHAGEGGYHGGDSRADPGAPGGGSSVNHAGENGGGGVRDGGMRTNGAGQMSASDQATVDAIHQSVNEQGKTDMEQHSNIEGKTDAPASAGGTMSKNSAYNPYGAGAGQGMIDGGKQYVSSTAATPPPTEGPVAAAAGPGASSYYGDLANPQSAYDQKTGRVNSGKYQDHVPSEDVSYSDPSLNPGYDQATQTGTAYSQIAGGHIYDPYDTAYMGEPATVDPYTGEVLQGTPPKTQDRYPTTTETVERVPSPLDYVNYRQPPGQPSYDPLHDVSQPPTQYAGNRGFTNPSMGSDTPPVVASGQQVDPISGNYYDDIPTYPGTTPPVRTTRNPTSGPTGIAPSQQGTIGPGSVVGNAIIDRVKNSRGGRIISTIGRGAQWLDGALGNSSPSQAPYQGGPRHPGEGGGPAQDYNPVFTAYRPPSKDQTKDIPKPPPPYVYKPPYWQYPTYSQNWAFANSPDIFGHVY